MPSNNTSPTFNLGAVTHETGLNADTLRAWERRYNLPQPARSVGGQRLYSPRDLEILKWLIQRQEEGMRISQAARLWYNQVEEGMDPLQESQPTETQIPIITGENIAEFKVQWISACKDFDDARAEQIISEAFSFFPPETVCLEILFSGLSEIGEAWYKGKLSIQQEHFASALVTRRLNALIAGTPPSHLPEKIIVATPPDEEHILSPLLITFLLRRHGWDVVYLGADVPIVNIETTLETVKPDLLILSAQQLHTAATLLDLSEKLHNQKIKLAYGGLIFNLIPSLRNRIPGNFLGKDLKNVIFSIEKQLRTTPLQPIFEIQDPSPLVEQFRSALPAIESVVHESLKNYPHIPSSPTRYLSRDISAALRLGNIDYLSKDIEWVSGLISFTHIPNNALQKFLEIYYQAVLEILEEGGKVILNWLQNEIDQLKNS